MSVHAGSALRMRWQPAPDGLDLASVRLQGQPDHLKRKPGLCMAAHEDVGCGKTEFRPGMDGDVRLRQQHDPGDALPGAKRMKMAEQNLRTRLLRAMAQQAFHGAGIAQFFCRDAMHIGQQMRAGGLVLRQHHLCPPLPLPQEPPPVPECEFQLLPDEAPVLLAERTNLVQLTPDDSRVTAIA